MNPNVIPINGSQEECNVVRASVKAVSKNSLMVDIGAAVINARTAFSCLVEPMAGDTVLINRSGKDYYVLAVLEREQQQDMTLAFPASVKMTASEGRIDFIAGKDINLSSTANTRLISKNISMTSAAMEICTARFTAHASQIETHSQSVKLYTDLLSTVTEKIIQKTGMLVRWVETVETLSIGNLIQNVRRNYTSHSNQAVITARKDMRIDGERIHMG